TGSQGPQGPPGTPAVSLWAVVDSTGTLSRGVSGVSSVQISTGLYRVTFTSDVSSCAYFAQIGDVGTGTGSTGLTRVRSSSITNTAVVVETYRISTNGSTISDDYPFHIFVTC